MPDIPCNAKCVKSDSIFNNLHDRTCPNWVDLAREENKRAIREDIDADFDREPVWMTSNFDF